MLHLRLPLPNFMSADNLIVGPGSIMALRGLESSKVAIIASGSLIKQDALFAKFVKNIRAHDITVVQRSWHGEPSFEDLELPLKQLESFQPDTILAVGGGSVIDASKLIWMFYEHPDLSIEECIKVNGVPPLRGRANFIAIPTTIGTGSEVSSSALLLNRETGRKEAVVSHDFLPDLVVLDQNLLVGLPLSTKISTVCDALSHAIEGYVSRIKNPLMDIFAEKAITLISENWKAAIIDDDEDALGQLLYAATLAGWVQNHCLVGAAHAIAHQMAKYGVPHGHANAILLPNVIRFNGTDEKTESRYLRIAELCLLEDNFEALAVWIEEIRSYGNFPTNLKDYGNIDIAANIEGALADPAAKSNPVLLDKENLEKIIKSCL